MADRKVGVMGIDCLPGEGREITANQGENPLEIYSNHTHTFMRTNIR